MGVFRRAGPWAASIALHAVAGAVAFLTISGIASKGGTPVEPDATYEVTLRPGGGPMIEDAPRSDDHSYGITQDTVTIDETPLTGVPDLPLASSIEPPSSQKPGQGMPPRAIQHGAVAKFPCQGGGGGSPGPRSGAGSGNGTGSGVGEGRDDGVEAVPTETPSPVYPEAARRGNLQGVVIAEIRIDAQGKVESARAAEGSGSAILDDAALQAVRAWRYQPATRGGQPIPSVRRVRFVFKLE